MDAARDAATHEQVPTASKFPGGFERMIGRIHALPMKFGLYTAMGAQTCGKFAASCGHEALDAKTYAEWGVDFVKDDACGNCGTDTTLEAYAAMQQGIWASGRSMVLSIEGQPDPKQSSECGYGQMRRVGHDMVNTYKSAIGLVDLGSRLFPFAHNGSKYNATCGGFWNDLEILHIGDGEFAHSYNGPEGASPGSVAANSHFTMWVVCKAPLLLVRKTELLFPSFPYCMALRKIAPVSEGNLKKSSVLPRAWTSRRLLRKRWRWSRTPRLSRSTRFVP